jgi:hypothetical protein
VTDDTLVDPGLIDLAFEPRIRADVDAVEIGDEAVLHDAASGDLLHLNEVATVVCSWFDGATPVAEIVGGLAEGLDVPTEVVEADVLRLVRDLGYRGLLVGVAGTVRHVIEHDHGC